MIRIARTETSKVSLCKCVKPLQVVVGNFRLPLPLAFFTFFFPQRVFPVQLSQNEFPHAYVPLLHPASATKLTFETTWKMSNFRISFFEKRCQPPQWFKLPQFHSATPSQCKWPSLLQGGNTPGDGWEVSRNAWGTEHPRRVPPPPGFLSHDI